MAEYDLDTIKIEIDVSDNGVEGKVNKIADALDRLDKTGGKGDAAKQIADTGRAASDAAKRVSRLSTALGSVGKAVARITFYRALRSAIKAVTEAYETGAENAYWFSRKYNEGAGYIAAALDKLSSNTFKMQNQLGASWATLLSTLTPIITQIINLITRAADIVTQFFAALGGESVYLKAIDYTKAMYTNTAKGAKAAKEWKNQLLGFDEINRLNNNTTSGGGGGGGSKPTDYKNMFEATEISKKIKDSLGLIEAVVGGSLLGLGAILFFSGASPLLGLGLMAAGSVFLAKSLTADWSSAPRQLARAIGDIMAIVGLSAMAIGTVLLFTGHVGMGIGMILAGASSFTAANIIWGKINGNVREQLTNLLGLGSLALMGLGMVLAFAGHPGLGIAMLIAGGAMGVTAVTLNWDAILDRLKQSWQNIKDWWNTNIAKYFTLSYWQDLVNETFSKIEFPHIKLPHLEITWEIADGWFADTLASWGFPVSIPHIGISWYAQGGFPDSGEMFMARENGPELVGRMGNRNAVINNSQIISGVAEGVFEAVVSAMSQSGGGSDRPIVIKLDGKEIARTTTKYQNQMARATG